MYSLPYQRSWAAAFQLIIFRCLDLENCLWEPEQRWRDAFLLWRIMDDGKEERNLLTVVIQHLLSIGISPRCLRSLLTVRCFSVRPPPKWSCLWRPVYNKGETWDVISIFDVRQLRRTSKGKKTRRFFLVFFPQICLGLCEAGLNVQHGSCALRGYHTNPALIALFLSWPSTVNSRINT